MKKFISLVLTVGGVTAALFGGTFVMDQLATVHADTSVVSTTSADAQTNDNTADDATDNTQSATPAKPVTPAKPKVDTKKYYIKPKAATMVLAKGVTEYTDTAFASKVKKLAKGTQVKVTAVEYSKGGTPRFKMSNGHYVTTAKASWRAKVTKSVTNYYTVKPATTVKVKKNTKLYKDTAFKNKKKTVKKGTNLKVKGIAWSKGGTPRLKVTGGYITAKKNISSKLKKTVKANYKASTLQTNFVKKYANDVYAVTKQYGLYGSVQMAQAGLESAWGTSGLTKKGHNFFGVKGTYKGKSVTMRTAEYTKSGKLYYTNAKFRKYPNAKASFADNAKKLKDGPGFSKTYYAGTWRSNAKTYKQAAHALVGRYATDPHYDDKLLALINTYHLHKLLD